MGIKLVQVNNGGYKSMSNSSETSLTRDEVEKRISQVAQTRYQGQLLSKALDGVFGKAFDKNFSYFGQLGYFYQSDSTSFTLWAPTAYSVKLNIYESYDQMALADRTVSMSRKSRGVWQTTVTEDLQGKAYDFTLEFLDGARTVSPDPYARACIANGHRSVVLSDQSMRPNGFPVYPRERSLWASRTIDHAGAAHDPIVEMHIRDFTISDSSGVERPLRGTFLGAVQRGTHTPLGSPTGLDYLMSQGIRYVQILPMYDYGTVDELQIHRDFGTQYNWGYDPVNYNVPEGSYSTDPANPSSRILEMKQMVDSFQKVGIRVIMDVVYNHVYDAETHPFQLTVPGYFFRRNRDGSMSNGTVCGNDLASERTMARKYIVDSVVYWATAYHVDGFRFDLMGNLDIDTMNAVRRALDAIDPTLTILGEGWDLNTALPLALHASQTNAHRLPKISFFNDTLRDAIKGDTFEAKKPGFAAGNQGQEKIIASEMLGGYYQPHYFLDASQRVQYVEVHDNFTLFDKLSISLPGESLPRLQRRCNLATSMILLSLGIPEIQLGQEFLRTKNKIENSYKSPDTINSIDWSRSEDFRSSVQYVRDLIAFRRTCPYLSMTDYQQISHHVRILRQDAGVVAFEYFDTTKKNESYVMIFNATDQSQQVGDIDSGVWQIVVSDGHVWPYSSLPKTYRLAVDDQCEVGSLDTLVLRSTYKQ